MSALDKLRSFAESRSADHELIRDGLTYGDVRDALRVLSRVETLEKAWAMVHEIAGIKPDGVAGLIGWIEARKELIQTLVYWHCCGHIDESWWDEARRLAGGDS